MQRDSYNGFPEALACKRFANGQGGSCQVWGVTALLLMARMVALIPVSLGLKSGGSLRDMRLKIQPELGTLARSEWHTQRGPSFMMHVMHFEAFNADDENRALIPLWRFGMEQ